MKKDKLGLKILKSLSGFNDGQTLNGLLELLGYSQYRFGKYTTENQVNKVKKELDSLIKMGYVEEDGLGYKETRVGRVYLDSFDYGSYAEGGMMAKGGVNEKDNILFLIGGTICSVCMILFTVALLFDNNQSTDLNEDWVGITWAIGFFIGVILFLIGSIIGPSFPKTNKR